METHITIYTDGSCLGNPGKGGFGYILRYNEHYKEDFGGYILTTNNRMEIIAVIRALQNLKKPSPVILYTDSQYIRNAIEEKWIEKWIRSHWKTSNKKPVKNKDLWLLLLPLLQTHSVEFKWVKAHNGNVENERCDELAKQGAMLPEHKQEVDTNYIESLL